MRHSIPGAYLDQANAQAVAGGSGGVGAQEGRCAEVAPQDKGRRCDRAQRDLQFCIRSIHFGSRDDGCPAFIDAFTFKLRISRSREFGWIPRIFAASI